MENIQAPYTAQENNLKIRIVGILHRLLYVLLFIFLFWGFIKLLLILPGKIDGNAFGVREKIAISIQVNHAILPISSILLSIILYTLIEGIIYYTANRKRNQSFFYKDNNKKILISAALLSFLIIIVGYFFSISLIEFIQNNRRISNQASGEEYKQAWNTINNISGSITRTSTDSGTMNSSSASCEEFKNKEKYPIGNLYESCIFKLIAVQKDYSLCNQLGDTLDGYNGEDVTKYSLKQHCVTNYMLEDASIPISTCDIIETTPGERYYWVDYDVEPIIEKQLLSGPQEYCKKTVNKARYTNNLNAAITAKDVTFCNNFDSVSDSGNYNACVLNVAKNTRDHKVCSLITPKLLYEGNTYTIPFFASGVVYESTSCFMQTVSSIKQCKDIPQNTGEVIYTQRGEVYTGSSMEKYCVESHYSKIADTIDIDSNSRICDPLAKRTNARWHAICIEKLSQAKEKPEICNQLGTKTMPTRTDIDTERISFAQSCIIAYLRFHKGAPISLCKLVPIGSGERLPIGKMIGGKYTLTGKYYDDPRDSCVHLIEYDRGTNK